MIDYLLIKLMLSSEHFNKYSKVINLEFYKQNQREIFKIFLALFKLHEDHTDITLNDLQLFYYTQYPAQKQDDKTLIDSIFAKIEQVDYDEGLAIDYLQKHHDQTLATQIAMEALNVSKGKGDLGTVRELLEKQHSFVIEEEEDNFAPIDLEVLVDEVLLEVGLLWRLNTMNKTIGSLRKGNFGFVFARPETGKTTFLASEITFMAEQAKIKESGPVIYVCNEEPKNDVMLRCYQAVFGVESRELYTNLQQYKALYEEKVGSHLLVYSKEGSMTKQDIEKLFKEYKPSLVVIDQLDNITWTDSERYDLKMKALYRWARELAKEYCPIIAVCQAGGTAEGKKYLSMNDVDSSHTAKQGTADFMIGIGKTNQDGDEYQRYLSISKNKLGRDIDCISELKHAKVPLTIRPDLARYEDVMKWT